MVQFHLARASVHDPDKWWVTATVGFIDTCSSPRKEKNSKFPTGENLVPCKQIIKVNPNGGKQGGIPEKESLGIAITKGDPNGRQTE